MGRAKTMFLMECEERGYGALVRLRDVPHHLSFQVARPGGPKTQSRYLLKYAKVVTPIEGRRIRVRVEGGEVIGLDDDSIVLIPAPLSWRHQHMALYGVHGGLSIPPFAPADRTTVCCLGCREKYNVLYAWAHYRC